MKWLLLILLLSIASLMPAGLVITLDNGTRLDLYSDYYALVIGNSDYQHFPKLRGVKQDVKDVKATLEKLGVNVSVQENLTGAQMQKAFNDFVDIHGKVPNRALILYYAGHGYTEERADGSDLGYIIPIDAPFFETNRSDFRNKSVSMTQINEYAALIRSKHVLMVFDSCFSGTVFTARRAAPQIIDEKTSQPVRQFITAGAANEAVPDQSVFKTTFVKGLGDGYADLNRDGYVTGEELGSYLENEVVNYSKGGQHPKYGKIANPRLDLGDIVFALGTASEAQKTVTAPVPKPVIETVWLYGTLFVETNQAGDLYLNGELQQTLSAGQGANIRLVTGDYTVEMRSGGECKSQRVSVNKDQTSNVKFSFETKAQTAATTTPAPAQTQPNATPVNMVYVEGGTFSMGSNDGRDDEKPVHQVTVSSFYIGKYEVTQKEWVEVMGSNPSNWSGDNYPVECINWYNAVEYCNKRSIKEGLNPCYTIDMRKKDNNNFSEYDDLKWVVTCNWSANGYRLPTEAEWEYAASGGNKSKGYTYSGSDSIELSAWYNGNSGEKTHEIGTKTENELVINDMSGNVYEWCWDWYDTEYYKKSPRSDPKGPSIGRGRVLRGGAWFNDISICRVANRSVDTPVYRDYFYGLRLVRAIF